ncbi:non-homologous end joining protein Ku [Streptomyces alanosinicus]|uniref:non-homologous end joining protein Ku n=1 Tax=Streptomyces alanosinicus TaxID=68171 RepID=UPI0035713CBA
MPRTIWSGAISFGLVTVPCNVLSATEDHSIRFHQYHLGDMGRVRVKKVCELEDREVSQGEIGKGYEWVRGTKDTPEQIIPISDEELRQLPLPTAKAIEIEGFVPLESVDPLKIGEGYYLQPSGQVAAKPYKLLVQALGRSSKVAVAKYAWSGRERLGLLYWRRSALRRSCTRLRSTSTSRRSRARSLSWTRWRATICRARSSVTSTRRPWRRSSRRSASITNCPRRRSPSSRPRCWT